MGQLASFSDNLTPFSLQYTALSVAAMRGHTEVAGMLLDSGADIGHPASK